MIEDDDALPAVGLSLMLEPDFIGAALPLFEYGEVEVLEWSFDTGWGPDSLPEWAAELLDHFAASGRLLGHGVTYSPLSGRFTERQHVWLERLAGECATRRFRHVSEHFGFVTAGPFRDGPPLPVPRTLGTLEVGRDRLRRLADACGVPVGLENLAFAFGPLDVVDQGTFLEELLAPVDGFLLLDLHNLHCQAENFGVPVEELLDGYPLERVVELHVSGGSWSESRVAPGRVRRDTHDQAVPQEVLDLVPTALRRCPGVEYVVLERLGGTLGDKEDQERFVEDFRHLTAVVTETCIT
jgi:uncharacterized protein (UPF0276 family)